MTIFLFPIDEAAAKSRGEGRSPKLVSSDHCHMSEACNIELLLKGYIKEIQFKKYKKK